MTSIERTSEFKKDFKRLNKKHFNMEKLKFSIECILARKTDLLITKYKDHALTCNWQGYRELHVEPNWLLIYRIDSEVLILTLVRTGSHDQML